MISIPNYNKNLAWLIRNTSITPDILDSMQYSKYEELTAELEAELKAEAKEQETGTTRQPNSSNATKTIGQQLSKMSSNIKSYFKK